MNVWTLTAAGWSKVDIAYKYKLFYRFRTDSRQTIKTFVTLILMANSGAPRINQLVRVAKSTFRHAIHEPGFTEQLEKLKKFMTTVTAEDFCITPSLASKRWDYLPYVSDSPSACMEVFECPEFSLGIFLLKPNKSMPLHDHPGMHGLMKVLFGSMTVTSYSKPTENGDTAMHKTFTARHISTQTLTANSQPCCLRPHEGNIHEIKATSDPVAFLDILAPPYNPAEGRDCTYFYREASYDTTEAGGATEGHGKPFDLDLKTFFFPELLQLDVTSSSPPTSAVMALAPDTRSHTTRVRDRNES